MFVPQLDILHSFDPLFIMILLLKQLLIYVRYYGFTNTTMLVSHQNNTCSFILNGFMVLEYIFIT